MRDVVRPYFGLERKFALCSNPSRSKTAWNCLSIHRTHRWIGWNIRCSVLWRTETSCIQNFQIVKNLNNSITCIESMCLTNRRNMVRFFSCHLKLLTLLRRFITMLDVVRMRPTNIRNSSTISEVTKSSADCSLSLWATDWAFRFFIIKTELLEGNRTFMTSNIDWPEVKSTGKLNFSWPRRTSWSSVLADTFLTSRTEKYNLIKITTTKTTNLKRQIREHGNSTRSIERQ